MGDDAIKALFDSLEAEPRPEFIAMLRRRVELEWVDNGAPPTTHPRDHRHGSVELEEPARRQPGRHGGWRWDTAAVLTAVAATLAVLFFVIRTRDEVTPSNTTPPAATTTTTRSTTTTSLAIGALGGRLRGTIPVGNTADSIAIADDAVWVSGWDGSTVSRIDAQTNEVVTVSLGSTGTHLAVGEGGVWVGVDGGHLLRLDPLSGEVIATIDTAARPVSTGDTAPLPYVGDGAVWVQDLETGVVSRVDPQTNEVVAAVDLTAAGIEGASGLVIDGGLVWVNTCRGVVSIDQQTLAVSEPIALDGCGTVSAMADGSLWVGLPGGRTARIDPVAREVETVLDVGPAADAPFLAAGGGAVWRPLTTNTIARIDTATNAVTEILDLGRSGQVAGFAVGHGSLWAGDYAGRSVLRIDP